MMKQLIGIWIALALLGGAGLAQATLMDAGNQVVYDDASNLYWYRHLGSTYYKTYAESVNFYDNLVIGTLDNFHIASTDEFDSLMINDLDEIYQNFSTGITEGEPQDRWYVGRYGEEFSTGSEWECPTYHYQAGPTYHVGNDGIPYWSYYSAQVCDDMGAGNYGIVAQAWGVASPPAITYTLSVNKSGNGTGTVTSLPSGINCGSDCSEEYNDGEVVALTAVNDVSSTFAGWSGDCNNSGQVTMNSHKTCTASFTLNTYNITATTGSNGSISPSDTVVVNHGGSQTFSINPDLHYHVANVVVDAISVGAETTHSFNNVTTNHTIAAFFAINTYALTVTKAGSGLGTVSSVPMGISCGGDCSEVYEYGTFVKLTAIADADSSFFEWIGACNGSDTCVVTMDTVKSVTADFITDTNHNGIEDAWELNYFGDLETATSSSDNDKDYYTDLQEYLNWRSGEQDPEGQPYNPVIKNAPYGTGYSKPSSILLLTLPIILNTVSQ